jgi:hypothetical protein
LLLPSFLLTSLIFASKRGVGYCKRAPRHSS